MNWIIQDHNYLLKYGHYLFPRNYRAEENETQVLVDS